MGLEISKKWEVGLCSFLGRMVPHLDLEMHQMKNGDGNCSEMGKEMVDPEKGKQISIHEKAPSYQHKYPEPLATYKEIVENKKLFMDTLGKVHSGMATKFMVPTIGGRELDLHQLFVEVTSRGGLEKVVADKRWREITAAFNFPSTATNASFVLRKYYMSLLHHYEKIYFFGSKGWNSHQNAASNTPSVTSVPAEPMLKLTSSYLGVRKRRGNGEPKHAGPSLPTNAVVGVIDGKIEHGYLISVVLGTQKLRGVVFHTPEEIANQAREFSDIAAHSNAKGVRRRRRKKLSKRDPTHPKPNRSGYNFFFAEQHARLKPLHPGKDREISKMIGDLWNKLTEPEKAVYQERGVKDKERYRSEMAIYREMLNTGPVISNAVPIQQRPAESEGAIVDIDAKMEIDEGDLPEADENDSSSDDCSETEDKKSDDESEPELETPPASFAADISTEGDGFELRRGENVQAEAETANPSSSEDAESKKVSEQSIDHQ